MLSEIKSRLFACIFREYQELARWKLERRNGDLLPDSAPAEPVIGENDGDHGFSHGYEARQQAGIVAALCPDRGWQAIASHGRLFFGQTAGRLDGGPQNDRHAGTDASEHSAVAV